MEQRIIKHRFIDYPIDPATEILIAGTFNPDAKQNMADIFYGRNRNFLWKLLPVSLGTNNLKDKSRIDKFKFLETFRVSFIDLIAEVKVDVGEEINYDDCYIDARVTQWRDVIGEIKKLSNLRKVCFTRKTFSGIPRIREKIKEVEQYCEENRIAFKYLSTPARGYTESKQNEWMNFLSDKF